MTRWFEKAAAMLVGVVGAYAVLSLLPSTVLRWSNVALSCIALATLLASMIRRWHLLTPRIRRIEISFCGLLTVTAYGSGEAATQSAPAGVRVAMACVSLLSIVVCVLWRFDEDI